MKFHILTLFPEMVEQGSKTSITGRAIEKGILELNVVNIRDFTNDKHKKVDDYPYGGGAGMLMQAQPVFDAYQSLKVKPGTRVLYMSPQGKTFQQKMAIELAKEEEVVFLCGHYEGIDERVISEIVTDEVSLGDFVLTGGELPAMVMLDAISRMVGGVLNNKESANEESFCNDLLEYPQYTRPEVWNSKSVPEVLLSGNHEKINAWRLQSAEERTKQKRPDLYAKYELKKQMEESIFSKKRRKQTVLEAERLCKSFHKTVEASKKHLFSSSNERVEFLAVSQISLQLCKCEIVGVLGPNGAGKTTLLRMLGKLMTPSDGVVRINDNEGNEIINTIEMKKRIGYLSGNTKLYQRLTVREMLHVFGNIYGLSKEECKNKIDEIIQILSMEDFKDNRIERLSTGQTQRANIARCLIHSPSVYIFDEPTLGLDIISSDKIIEFMKQERNQGKSVLYSTHYMEEAQYLCDRIIMIDEGKIIAQGTPKQLMEMTQTVNLRETFHALVEVQEND